MPPRWWIITLDRMRREASSDVRSTQYTVITTEYAVRSNDSLGYPVLSTVYSVLCT